VTPGDAIWVDFEGKEWPAELVKVEKSGYLLCRVHFNDPVWDFGRGGARIMPEQMVAVRSKRVRERDGQGSVSDSSACGGEQAGFGS
jgi:hypothetical protein